MISYKDSGVNWIGNIPDIWEIKKIKYLATSQESLFKDGDWIETKDIEESGIRYLTSGNVGEGYYKEQGKGYISQETFDKLRCLAVYPGDLMISRLNLPVGRACIVPNGQSIYVVAVDNVILRPDIRYSKKYLMYIMNITGYAKEAELISRGTTMKRISRSLLGEIKIAIPNYNVQQEIVNFLDKKCLEIDVVIAKIEKQIELLKKYKKSLISETVTKGLNKNVPMKDSNIGWIGEIPKEWDVSKIKYSLILMGSGSTPDSSNPLNYDGEINWIQSGDLYGKSYITETEKTITKYALHGNKSLKRYIAPFVVVAMYGASVGNIALSQIDSYTNQACCVMKGDNSLNNKYLYYFLIANRHEMLMLAIGGTQPNISQQLIKNLKIIIPQFNDQQEIVDFLDKKCSEIDSVISKKESQLDLIREHRKSLIYEYVTGKKRVGVVNNGN